MVIYIFYREFNRVKSGSGFWGVYFIYTTKERDLDFDFDFGELLKSALNLRNTCLFVMVFLINWRFDPIDRKCKNARN